MSPIAIFLCAASIATLPSGAQSAAELKLACEGGLSAPVCRALATTLASAVGPIVLTETLAAGPGLRFVTEAHRPDILSGHLAWQGADGSGGTGPTLTLSVSDTTIDDAMLARFAAELLRHSGLPL